MLWHNGNVAFLSENISKNSRENKKISIIRRNCTGNDSRVERLKLLFHYFISHFIASIFPLLLNFRIPIFLPIPPIENNIIVHWREKNCDFLFEFKIILLLSHDNAFYSPCRYYGNRFHFDTYWKVVTWLLKTN